MAEIITGDCNHGNMYIYKVIVTELYNVKLINNGTGGLAMGT